MAYYLTFDNCGYYKWYVIGSKPYEDLPTHQIQVCIECGFAIKIIYNLVDMKFLTLDDVLKELKKKAPNQNRL